jgi:hypothetical protein
VEFKKTRVELKTSSEISRHRQKGMDNKMGIEDDREGRFGGMGDR